MEQLAEHQWTRLVVLDERFGLRENARGVTHPIRAEMRALKAAHKRFRASLEPEELRSIKLNS